ncbi:aromatic-ring-hydroxylating dioxygenase subunit beta [Jatrophihabitans cynanchi]|uniref:Aromatic-ring-hydroxylating dioxygenase subunit beta n=1 Tax=Jatrophihabitans cynanchi TaxID=2944128 RepID=A0ABY7K2H5_9ACTN|nr:aromatic-ring-hydroxylating dioxygenase subunit beta [Jatrophihabitans sp. SB3-54]WAX58400.1 aromatic-ring-hydroxylating dioxygenase subunit beta [Jatrophihabitans sp. SB3-54]
MPDLTKARQFLYHEADLMDRHAYDDWLALWTPDAKYLIPCNEDDYDDRLHVSIVNEDHAGLCDRVARLKSSSVWAQRPKSRLSRIIGNVRFQPTGPDGLVGQATFNLTAVRHGAIDVIAGRTEHRLRATPSGLRLVEKTVWLVTIDDVMPNLTFLL